MQNVKVETYVEKYKETINELRSYRELKKLEKYYKGRIEEITASMLGATGESLGVQSQQTEFAAEKIVDKLNKFYKDYYQAIDECYSTLRMIEEKINKLPIFHANILRMRYIELMKFEQISVAIPIDYRWLQRKHKEAVQKYAEL